MDALKQIIIQAISETSVNGRADFNRFKAAVQDLLSDYPQESKFFNRIADEKYWNICQRAGEGEPTTAVATGKVAAEYLQKEYEISPQWAQDISNCIIDAVYELNTGLQLDRSLYEEVQQELQSDIEPRSNPDYQDTTAYQPNNMSGQSNMTYDNNSAFGNNGYLGGQSETVSHVTPNVVPKKKGKTGIIVAVGIVLIIAIVGLGVGVKMMASTGKSSEMTTENSQEDKSYTNQDEIEDDESDDYQSPDYSYDNDEEEEDDVVAYFYPSDSDGVNLRSEPTHNSALVCHLEPGEMMTYYGEEGEGYGSDGENHTWYKVETENGQVGWARSDFVTK